MSESKFILLSLALMSFMVSRTFGRKDIWLDVPCNKEFYPEDCEDFNVFSSSYLTVDDFDRCGPAKILINARNYYLGTSGRGVTYKDNRDAYDRIRMKPKMLRGVTVNSIHTTVLGMPVDFPIGLSPVAMQKLAYPEGEMATLAGLTSIRTVMILSSYASTSIEEVAAEARYQPLHLWMQVYIFHNRSITIDIVRKAERSGFKAIVVTCDSPMDATLSCNSRMTVRFPPGIKAENLDYFNSDYEVSINFEDITWLKSITHLPIIAKGILSGDDARQAVLAGASAILVSNHGGRQVDGVPATIDALPEVVDAMQNFNPPIEVYLDGGVRSGSDVFKAIALGARMVFYGRPNIWGLALGGPDGVRRVINILKSQFNETMLLSGVSEVEDIGSDMLLTHRHTRKDPIFERNELKKHPKFSY